MDKEDLATLEEFRKALARITADQEAFKGMIEAHTKMDGDMFERILKQFELDRPICRLVCYFICWVQPIIRCERICKIICR